MLDPFPHVPAIDVRRKNEIVNSEEWDSVEEIYSDIMSELKTVLYEHRKKLQELVISQLEKDQQAALKDEKTRFQSRNAELSTLIQEKTIASKRKELETLKTRLKELPSLLFQEFAKQEEAEINSRMVALERELKNDQGHYEELREQLERERIRITQYLIPNRYALDGDIQIYPIAVEIVLPRKGAAEK